jgi:hypothetical protein
MVAMLAGDDAPNLEDKMRRYEATTHFNGQSTVRLDGQRATGES